MKKNSALRKRLMDSYHFDGDPAALVLLDELCLCVAQLHEVQERLSRDGLVIRGSVGQQRAHPLLAEQDRLRRAALALTRALRLSFDEVLDA